MQFLDYEKKNNIFIRALTTNALFSSVMLDLSQPDTYLVVSQSVTLEGTPIDKNFLYTHIIFIDSANPTHFVTKNGIIGLFSSALTPGSKTPTSLIILNAPPSNPPTTPSQLFSSNLFAAEKDYQIIGNPDARVILREGTITIKDIHCRVLLVSEPLCYEGCSWQIAKQSKQVRTLNRGGVSTSSLSSVSEPVKLIRTNSTILPADDSANRKSTFFDKLNHPSAAHIVSSIRVFVQNFLAQPADPEDDQETVREFLATTEDSLKKHPLWVNCVEKELDETREGLEKFVMVKLHQKLFGRSEELAVDEEISKQIRKLTWMQLEHLEINPEAKNDTAMSMACAELRKINSYKAPRDKLICILNCCKVVYKMLSLCSGQASAGADDFLPLLIIVVIRANPPHLHSNVQFIRRFRNPSKLLEEAGYYLTQLESGVHFLKNVKFSYLKNVTEEEFARLTSSEKFTPNGTSEVPISNENAEEHEPSETPTMATTCDGHQPSSEEVKSSLTRYQFMDYTAAQLKIGDVYQLLEDYKTLARQNEQLVRLLSNMESHRENV